MGKLIKLPNGVTFDPEEGVFHGGNLGSPPVVRPQRRIYTSYRNSWWSRVNEFVSDIGDWIADRSESISSYITLGLFVLSWIGFAIGIVSLWIDEGFITALLTGVIGGCIFYYVSMIVLGIFIFIMNIVLYIVRYLFYNVYTLLICIAVVVTMFLSSNWNLMPSFGRNSDTSVHVAAPQTTNYVCTAESVLNVRYAPTANSRVVGVLRPNQVVEVYEIVDGFAKIKYGSGVAYASEKYLRAAP